MLFCFVHVGFALFCCVLRKKMETKIRPQKLPFCTYDFPMVNNSKNNFTCTAGTTRFAN